MDGWVNDVYYRISDNLPGQTPDHDLSGAWVSPYQIDPLNPNVLVLGYANVYRTTNRGVTWTQISNNLIGTVGAKLEALTIAPSNSDIIYAAYSNKPIQALIQTPAPEETAPTTKPIPTPRASGPSLERSTERVERPEKISAGTKMSMFSRFATLMSEAWRRP